jgi:hypothetical protein
MTTANPTSSTRALRRFYEQTQQVNLFTGLALFLIVVVTVAPLTLNPFLVCLLKVVAVGLLGRAIYVTFTETQLLRNAQRGQGTAGAKSFLPTLSYILCGLLSLLLIYTLYMVVF